MTSPLFTTILLAIGATARITHFLLFDALFNRPRIWILNKVQRGWWVKLWSCPACMSIWAAGLIVVPWAALSGGSAWFVWPALVLTASWFVVVTS